MNIRISRKERQEKEIKEFQERVSALQRKGYTIHRVAKGGYDGEHWGYYHPEYFMELPEPPKP